MAKKKKIVFLSSNFGGGHNSAVEAIKGAIDKFYPEEYEYYKVNVVKQSNSVVEKIFLQFYDKTTKYSKITWKLAFEFSDKTEIIDLWDKTGYHYFKKQLSHVLEAEPDIIISCFPYMYYTITRSMAEQYLKVPFISFVTDTGDVHSQWISKRVDYYFTPTQCTTDYLLSQGIKEDKIETLGFLVGQSFYQPYSVSKLRKKFEIPDNNRVVLFFAGASGVGGIKAKVRAIDGALTDVTVIVVCGKNKNLPVQLNEMYFNNDVRVNGFIPNDIIAEYMKVSDVVITKAGGLSVMETVTLKKPVVITEITPGQEEPNAEFVERMGFGYVAKSPRKLTEKVKLLLEPDEASRIDGNYKNYTLNKDSDRRLAEFINKLI